MPNVTYLFLAYRITRMTTVAYAYLTIFPFQYNLNERAETCNFLDNTYCPVLEGEVIQYTLRMPIEEFMFVVSCGRKNIRKKKQ